MSTGDCLAQGEKCSAARNHQIVECSEQYDDDCDRDDRTDEHPRRRTEQLDVLGDGVVAACGGGSAGYVLYIDDGHPVYHYNWFGRARIVLRGSDRLPDGASTIQLDFLYDGGGAGLGGDAILRVNDAEVARTRIEHTVAGRFGIDTFGIGCDTGSPVCEDYTPPFAFTGTIGRVDIDLGEPGLDPDEEAALHARFTAGKEY
jgi:hypothetical protein